MARQFDLNLSAHYSAYAKAGVFAALLYAAQAAQLSKYADLLADDRLNVAVSGGGTITLENWS